MILTDAVRLKIREIANPDNNRAIVNTKNISLQIGVDISRVSRSIRDLQRRNNEIIREKFIGPNEGQYILLPKFFDKLSEISGETQSFEMYTDKTVTIRPNLASFNGNLSIAEIFPTLMQASKDVRMLNPDDLFYESRVATKILDRVFRTSPRMEMAIFSLIIKQEQEK